MRMASLSLGWLSEHHANTPVDPDDLSCLDFCAHSNACDLLDPARKKGLSSLFLAQGVN